MHYCNCYRISIHAKRRLDENWEYSLFIISVVVKQMSAFLYLFVLEIPCLLLDQAVLVDLDDQNFLVDLLLL